MALSSSSTVSTVANLATGGTHRVHSPILSIKCQTSPGKESPTGRKLEVGSPIIIVEAPKVIKTAASMPCLRANSGLVKPGDVGRIVSQKPKDVWAVRLAIGTYLLDGKYFKPLELDDE